MKWVDLGILNPPIYEREHNTPDVHRAESTRKVSMSGRGVKDGDRVACRGGKPTGGDGGGCARPGQSGITQDSPEE